MKFLKFNTLVIALSLFFNSIVYAQNEFSHTNIGVGIIYMNYEGYVLEEYDWPVRQIITKPIKGNISPLTAYFDFNFPIVKIKELSSFGINPGITISSNGMPSSSPSVLGFSVPVFINYKLGADAQLQNYGTKVGFTAGLGYQVAGYGADDFEFISTQPVAMSEICLRSKRSLVHKLRFMGALGSINHKKMKDGAVWGNVKISNYMGFFYLMNF